MFFDFLFKTSLPNHLPLDMEVAVEELKKSSDKKECLEKSYKILTSKYKGHRIKTYTRFFEIFKKDINYLWKKEGFLHCININYLLRILLIKSGFFKEKEIIMAWALVWHVSPHQYVKVKVNGEIINIDIWAHNYGIKFGDYARGFHKFFNKN